MTSKRFSFFFICGSLPSLCGLCFDALNVGFFTFSSFSARTNPTGGEPESLYLYRRTAWGVSPLLAASVPMLLIKVHIVPGSCGFLQVLLPQVFLPCLGVEDRLRDLMVRAHMRLLLLPVPGDRTL